MVFTFWMTLVEGSPMGLGWASGEGKVAISSKREEVLQDEGYKNLKMKIDSKRREGGNRIALAQGRGEWRQECYPNLSEGKQHWRKKPLPGQGAAKGSKGKLMSKGKKMKEKRRRKGGGGNEKGNWGISIYVAGELYWDEERGPFCLLGECVLEGLLLKNANENR